MPGSRGAKTRQSDGEPELLVVAGREIAISNPRKVLFPKPQYTKLDLVRYYLAVADGALRGAGGRPNMLVRYPNGIAAESFYQKRAPGSPISPASSCTRIPFAPKIWTIPTSCESTSIPFPASSGCRCARWRRS